MPPQPTKEVELDMERKEELIIAKQLRACRVNILPRATLETFGHQKKPQKIATVNKNHLDIPKPKIEHVEKASNPIALRYWNQCMSAAGNSTDVSPNRSSDASPSFEAQEFKIEATTNQFAFNFTGVSTSIYDSSPQSTFFNDKEKPPPLPAKTSANKSTASPSATNNGADSPFSFYQSDPYNPQPKVIVEKVLSTAGQGIKRENEKQEAKLNLNRFITMGMLNKSAGDSKPTENKLTTGETTMAPSNGANNNQNGQRKATAVDGTNGSGQAAKAGTDYNRYDSGISSFSSDESEEENENINRERGQSSSTLQNSTNSVIFRERGQSSSTLQNSTNSVIFRERGQSSSTLQNSTNSVIFRERGQSSSTLQNSTNSVITNGTENGSVDAEKVAAYLGMLFYKEMTEELIKEILAQELMSRSMRDLASIIPDRLKQEILKSELAKLGTRSANMVLDELQMEGNNNLETLIPQPDSSKDNNIPQIVISQQQDSNGYHNGRTNGHGAATNNGHTTTDENDDEGWEKSAADSYVSAYSDIDNTEKGDKFVLAKNNLSVPVKNGHHTGTDTFPGLSRENVPDPDGWSDLASEGTEEGVLLEDLEEWEEHEEEMLVQTFDATFNIVL